MDNVTTIRIIAGFIFLLVIPVMIVPYWVIFKKAGFSPALSLLMLLPLINLIVLYVVAFSNWRTLQLPKSDPLGYSNYPGYRP
jgi:hypothetical protein